MQAILDLAAEHELEGKEATLDKLMEMGQYVHFDVRPFLYAYIGYLTPAPR